ncbi:MAG: FmdB family zinc ribbon protein [Oceanococcus sp.]
MPIYEYRCNSCEHEMEALRKMSDPPLTHCPACETENLVKRISAAAFRLKGGGWYETDFKKEGQRNLAGDAGSGKTKTTDSAKKTPDSAKSTAAPVKSASKSDSAA